MARDECWYCGGQLCWDNDFNYEEVYGEGTGTGIVTYLHCLKCGATVEYVSKDEDKDGQ